jgi:hypothetical protein
VVAPCSGCLDRITPRLAQHADVRHSRKCQHDRQNSCSKHGTLIGLRGKSRARLRASETANSSVFLMMKSPKEDHLAGFRRWVPKIPHSILITRACRSRALPPREVGQFVARLTVQKRGSRSRLAGVRWHVGAPISGGRILSTVSIAGGR